MSEQDPTTPKPTSDQVFKARFINLIKDLGENAAKDPETVWLIGSLAGSIIEENKQKSWKELKLAMSRDDAKGLLAAFQTQGEKLAKAKNYKSAYAVETLAMSVIAPTMHNDAHLVEGNKLLDSMIADAIAFYRNKPATTSNIN